jgi:hypothetical protein
MRNGQQVAEMDETVKFITDAKPRINKMSGSGGNSSDIETVKYNFGRSIIKLRKKYFDQKRTQSAGKWMKIRDRVIALTRKSKSNRMDTD